MSKIFWDLDLNKRILFFPHELWEPNLVCFVLFLKYNEFSIWRGESYHCSKNAFSSIFFSERFQSFLKKTKNTFSNSSKSHEILFKDHFRSISIYFFCSFFDHVIAINALYCQLVTFIGFGNKLSFLIPLRKSIKSPLTTKQKSIKSCGKVAVIIGDQISW